jgi:hypothetical protein
MINISWIIVAAYYEHILIITLRTAGRIVKNFFITNWIIFWKTANKGVKGQEKSREFRDSMAPESKHGIVFHVFDPDL